MTEKQWKADCTKWRNRVLTGQYAHYCLEWDELPVDETCGEILFCRCFGDSEELTAIKQEWESRMQKWDYKKEVYDESGTL